MTFSQSTGCNFVPLLARIVLGAAFILAGWGKVFQEENFDAGAIRALEGAADTAADETPPGDEGENNVAMHQPQWRIVQANDRLPNLQDAGPDTGQGDDQAQDQAAEEQDDAGGEGAQDAQDVDEGDRGAADEQDSDDEDLDEDLEDVGDDIEDAAQDATEEVNEAIGGDEADDVTPPGMVKRKGLFKVALMLDNAGWEYSPVLFAWIAALTELIGGVLMLFGFLSRIWGLGLAITMAFAFYLTTLTGAGLPMADAPSLLDGGLHYLTEDPNYPARFNTMFVQLGFFVLAFGVFLTGPGAVSVDRLIFGREEPREKADVDLT